MYVRKYVCMNIYMYVRTYVRMYVSIYVCTYVRMYICMYVLVNIMQSFKYHMDSGIKQPVCNELLVKWCYSTCNIIVL